MSLNLMHCSRLAVLLLVAGLSACGGMQTAPVEDRHAQKQAEERVLPPVDSTDSEPVAGQAVTYGIENLDEADPQPAEVSESTPSGPVVLAALDEAETHAAGGNTRKAIASLERGIRIKPRDPWLWHQLGVLKLRSGDWLDAISIAQKSNSLAGNNRQLLMGNWQVIADANEALGNLAEAERARRNAESYIQE